MARADTVPRPKKEMAVPAAGQPFMAEPDFGTGKNVVIPFPSAQGNVIVTADRDGQAGRAGWLTTSPQAGQTRGPAESGPGPARTGPTCKEERAVQGRKGGSE